MPHRPTPHTSSARPTRANDPWWQGLPDEARLTLTGLMVRLIRDHAAGAEVSVSMRDAGPGHREEPAELPTGLGDGTPAWGLHDRC